jgi:hypothetical protein
MRNLFKGLAFTALIALSMLASTGDAFAKDTKHGRETAWTWTESAWTWTEPAPDLGLVQEFLGDGVTWEE